MGRLTIRRGPLGAGFWVLLLRDGRSQLGVDDLLERLERQRPDQLPAVDEEGGRAGGAEDGTRLHVGPDQGLVAVPLDRRVELAQVEADLLRQLIVEGGRELVLAREELVVHLPEL